MSPTADKPFLVVADDDPAGRGRVEEELLSRYAGDYEVRACATGELRDVLAAAHEGAREVAVVLASCEGGAELLADVRRLFPTARRGLLIPWLGWAAMWVIGLAEGIIYLTNTDEQFQRIYVVGRREWF